MAKQTIRRTSTKQYIRNSSITTDSKGRKHCKTCGAYVGNKGRK
jgi:hypothetical protein